jgi:hypothetical protein
MWIHATVTAYDLLDSVHVVANVRVSPDAASDDPPPALTIVTSVPGEGQTDAREWLRDALIALLEDL